MTGNRYASAKEIYAAQGVDTEAAIQTALSVPLSVHCWQGDDLHGFLSGGSLGGGLATTGNCPGAAQNPAQLLEMLETALRDAPGKLKINVHAFYATPADKRKDWDALEAADFQIWLDFARAHGWGLDINPTLFNHRNATDGMTLAHPDAGIRRFWIDHCKQVRKIGAHWGKTLGQTVLNNIWIPDGLKDVPGDRGGPRARLKESLDEIFSVRYDAADLADAAESKLFGLGVESYTVGSHEFYMNYAAKKGILCLLDAGHFHPTERISDKISALLLFNERLALHLSRGVRWDSDHVVTLDDELKEIFYELVRCRALERTFIALDYFDASINRMEAWRIGLANARKALLIALLTPQAPLKAAQDAFDFTTLIRLHEDYKLLPWADVWHEICARSLSSV
jgi:L-rhamnose isomerase